MTKQVFFCLLFENSKSCIPLNIDTDLITTNFEGVDVVNGVPGEDDEMVTSPIGAKVVLTVS